VTESEKQLQEAVLLTSIKGNLVPHLSLKAWFLQIVENGNGKEFSPEQNRVWLTHTRPIARAFFHARYMLEMIANTARYLKLPLPCYRAVGQLYCTYTKHSLTRTRQ
jgi:hypothetical protein